MKILMMSLVLAVMAGCTTFHPKPLSPSETASAFEARTLDSPDLKAFLEEHLHREISPWPPKSWDFMLLTLVALSYHPDLDVARAQWEIAKAEVTTASHRPNPRLTFVPKFVSNAASGASPWILDFPLDIPLETAGKRGYRIAQAQDRSAAARLHIAAVAWQVRSRLRASLLDLYAAHQAEVLLQQQQGVQEAIVKVLDQRLAFGEVSQPDVTQAHLALDRIRLSLREAYKQHVGARAQLAEALGLPVGALEGAELSFDVLHRFPLATDGTLISATLVSPSPHTDPRVQGLSFFYVASAATPRLVPGMNILAYLPVGPQVSGVVIPAPAIVWWQGKAWVYVQQGADRFVRREVPTENQVHDGWFVTREFSAGDRLVVRGAQALLSEEFRARIQVRG
jgi:hypothetical protein